MICVSDLITGYQTVDEGIKIAHQMYQLLGRAGFQLQKWSHRTPVPNVGDVVWVMEDDMPPARWLYGWIVDEHTGSDGITRVVSLRYKDSVIKRPVSKLIVLPIA